ncbi:MAG: serine/threonine protein kinase [Labilithrix sp.]|nr:serine/threonine protein kinase [Labilithrix sp.]MCW5815896.1 serine/threonine protein kinase [Labilithrix sp.]
MTCDDERVGPEKVGRYVLHAEIARGGMASVHAARVTGAEGFHRLVAAKRLHPEYAEDPEFVTMFHDEARIASRIHHPNVVPVLDVVVTGAEVMLVQEYVHGVPLSVVMRRARMALKPIPTGISVAIVAGVLAGLHAAHEARDELGTPLDVIHRDVSPQNIMLSTEGVPRLLDFGIAKARTSAHQTRPGVMKGKLSYMAPEQIKADPITRRADVYAAGVVMWELLANRRIGESMSETDYLSMLFDGTIPTLVEECSAWRRSMGQAGWKRLIALDAVVMRAISLAPGDRYATALEMAEAMCTAHPPATQADLGAWLAEVADDHMARLRRTLAQSEEEWRASSRVEAATLSRRSVAVAADPDPAEERMTVPTPRVFFPEELEAELAAVAQPSPRSVEVDESELVATAKRPPRGEDGALFVLPRSSPCLEPATPSAGFAPLAEALDSAQLAAAAAAREALESGPRLPAAAAPSSGALPASEKRRSSRDAPSSGALPAKRRDVLSDSDARLAALVDGPIVMSPFARAVAAHDSAPPESVPAMTQSGAPAAAGRRRVWPWLVAAACVFAASFVATRHVSRAPAAAPSPPASSPPAPAATVPPLPAALLEITPVATSTSAEPAATACVPAASTSSTSASSSRPPPPPPAAKPVRRECKPVWDPVKKAFTTAACRR